MENMVRAHTTITGKVQGVFFRMETQRAARSQGVSGWVRNKMDGSVEAIFEGAEADVKATLAWCREGPPHARVSRVDVVWQEYTGAFETFEVTY
jgi:acylphosphatase